MTKTVKLLASVSALAVSALGASPAFAAGTAAGSSIVNTVTVGYQVGGVSQTAINASNTFVVDRKINLLVAEADTTTTLVAPGALAQVTAFTVQNTSNATLDYRLTVAQAATNSTAVHGGTDKFDVANIKIFVDANNNGTYEPAVDVATYIDELDADEIRTVFVVGDIPNNRVNNDVAGVTLTATSAEGGTASTLGADVTQTSGANTAGMDTVFADGQIPTDTVRDGKASARDDYTVSAATLTVTKTSTIISDPLNGTTNPKMIPGATVAYCITVANAAGSAAATNVAINDPVPTQTLYVNSSGFVNGTAACASDGSTTAATYTAVPAPGQSVVAGTIASLPAGTTRSLYFRVTIN